MDYDRIRTFINSYNRDDAGLLGEIHSEALSSCVPIIRDETREFLKLIIAMQKPEHILELGTAVG
nr:O-methyltransferase [Eubacterium sp.]